MESDERLLLSPAGGGRDAGAGARIRARHRDRGARHREGLRRGGGRRVRRGGRAHLVLRQCRLRFVTEICKMRAFAELWDEITAQRYGVNDPKQRLFRYGVQVNSLGLTEQQPENNVTRILIEMLAVTLSKNARARAVQLPAWNEALGLPRPWDQQWSLRMQQILAYETDLLEYGDIFDGSPEIAAKVDELKRAGARGTRAHRSAGRRRRGGRAGLHEAAAGRIEHRAASRRSNAASRRSSASTGSWRASLRRSPARPTRSSRCRTQAEAEQIERLNAWRAERDQKAVDGGAEGAARGGAGGPQHHAGLDRLRQSRRHHRRMGLRAARRLRRVSRADRRRPRRAQRQPRRSTTCAPTSTACRASSAGG